MKTRIIAMVLGLLMLIPLFSSCADVLVESQLQMYLSHQVYDLDPINAFTNDAQLKIVSLIFAGLYKIDENGKVKNDLVKSTEVINDEEKGEYSLVITLRDTCWSDGSAVSSDDVVYTFRRVLKAQVSNDAAALLYKIKDAIAVKNGEASIDDLGVSAEKSNEVQISFENYITDEVLEEFKLAMTSPIFFPLRENYVDGKPDWAKKPATMVCSGPFIVRRVAYEEGREHLLLERNPYYLRDREKDDEDKYVTPYRIMVDYAYSSEEDQIALFENGQVLFAGEIPLSMREQYKGKATITDNLSTHTYYFNQEALIASTKAGEEEGFKLFSVAEVRKALSLAIDRTAIANSVVFAKAATGLVPGPVFATTSVKSLFRDSAGAVLATSANVTEAQALITQSGINPSDYSFSISVRECDEVHIAIADAVAAAWNSLGFKVTVKPVGIIVNPDKDPGTGEVDTTLRDDLYEQDAIGGDFEVLALDYVAKAPTAYSMLAPFAIDFTGNRTVNGAVAVTIPHFTGYNSSEYNDFITAALNAQTAEEMTTALCNAEKILLDDAAVMPIVFNQTAVLINSNLKKLTQSYFGYYYFSKASYKEWVDYNNQYFPETSEEAAAGDKTDEPI